MSRRRELAVFISLRKLCTSIKIFKFAINNTNNYSMPFLAGN